MTQTTHYILQGLQYNYPICCINYFVNNAGTKNYWYKDKPHLVNSIFSGTGFIPCPKCMKSIEGLSKEQASFKLLNRNIFA